MFSLLPTFSLASRLSRLVNQIDFRKPVLLHGSIANGVCNPLVCFLDALLVINRNRSGLIREKGNQVRK